MFSEKINLLWISAWIMLNKMDKNVITLSIFATRYVLVKKCTLKSYTIILFTYHIYLQGVQNSDYRIINRCFIQIFKKSTVYLWYQPSKSQTIELRCFPEYCGQTDAPNKLYNIYFTLDDPYGLHLLKLV